MFKILLISVIAVTLAQDTRYDGERRRLKVNDVRLNREAGERVDERPPIHEHVGGFQNGNFAYTDGILKTNLNSSQTVKERQNFRPREDTYLHEGAAFKSPGNVQFDVHSSRGRGEVSHEVADEYRPNSNEQENQRNQYTNHQSDGQRNQNENYNAQSNRGEGNLNRFNTQNTQINRQDDKSKSTDHSVQIDQNSEYANREISDDQNRQSGRGQNTQQINNQRSESRRGSSETNERSIATNTNSNHYDRDAIDREMSNQISNMYFKEGTEPASGGKKTSSNEARNGTKGQGDRWIWGGDGAPQTTTPGVDNRASFVGDQCPTGQVKFNNVCVDED